MKSNPLADGALAPSALLASSATAPLFPDRDDEDQDTGDLPGGVDEDALEVDDLDTDRVVSLD